MRNIYIVKSTSGRIEIRTGSASGDLMFSVKSSSSFINKGNGILQFNENTEYARSMAHSFNVNSVYATVLNGAETLFTGTIHDLMNILSSSDFSSDGGGSTDEFIKIAGDDRMTGLHIFQDLSSATLACTNVQSNILSANTRLYAGEINMLSITPETVANSAITINEDGTLQEGPVPASQVQVDGQEGRIVALETDSVNQDGRLSVLESDSINQDERISELEKGALPNKADITWTNGVPITINALDNPTSYIYVNANNTAGTSLDLTLDFTGFDLTKQVKGEFTIYNSEDSAKLVGFNFNVIAGYSIAYINKPPANLPFPINGSNSQMLVKYVQNHDVTIIEFVYSLSEPICSHQEAHRFFNSEDFNNYTVPGDYSINNDVLTITDGFPAYINGPTNGNFGVLSVSGALTGSSSTFLQHTFKDINGTITTRARNTSTWTDWEEVITDAATKYNELIEMHYSAPMLDDTNYPNQDWNDLLKNKMYGFGNASTHTNKVNDKYKRFYGYGVLDVIDGGTFKTQIAYGHGQGHRATRVYYLNNDNWSEWQSIGAMNNISILTNGSTQQTITVYQFFDWLYNNGYLNRQKISEEINTVYYYSECDILTYTDSYTGKVSTIHLSDCNIKINGFKNSAYGTTPPVWESESASMYLFTIEITSNNTPVKLLIRYGSDTAPTLNVYEVLTTANSKLIEGPSLITSVQSVTFGSHMRFFHDNHIQINGTGTPGFTFNFNSTELVNLTTKTVYQSRIALENIGTSTQSITFGVAVPPAGSGYTFEPWMLNSTFTGINASRMVVFDITCTVHPSIKKVIWKIVRSNELQKGISTTAPALLINPDIEEVPFEEVE